MRKKKKVIRFFLTSLPFFNFFFLYDNFDQKWSKLSFCTIIPLEKIWQHWLKVLLQFLLYLSCTRFNFFILGLFLLVYDDDYIEALMILAFEVICLLIDDDERCAILLNSAWVGKMVSLKLGIQNISRPHLFKSNSCVGSLTDCKQFLIYWSFTFFAIEL